MAFVREHKAHATVIRDVVGVRQGARVRPLSQVFHSQGWRIKNEAKSEMTCGKEWVGGCWSNHRVFCPAPLWCFSADQVPEEMLP